MSHRYIALTQPPYCCVPTALLMILIRRKLPLLQIIQIGYELGLAVPETSKVLFPDARIGVKPTSGFGTEIQNPKYTLNAFFERNKYPLRETYYQSVPKNEGSNWVHNLIRNNADVIACFNSASLFRDNTDWGHACLIDKVENHVVTLVDTEVNQPKFRTVKFDALLSAISKHGEANRAGFWVINSA
jgi:hypothetical protein